MPILLLSHAFGWSSVAQTKAPFQRVIIEITKPYDSVVEAIRVRGGRVTHQFQQIDGIAAEIPVDAWPAIRPFIGSASVWKDADLAAPAAAQPGYRSPAGKPLKPIATVRANSWKPVSAASISNAASTASGSYSLNNHGTNIDQLHALGYTGAGITVAVIDSGIRPGFPLLDSDSSVIGGEDLVGDGLGFSNNSNDGHGTFAAGLISGNAEFDVNGALANAIAAHAPPNTLNSANKLPIVGTAPASKIYALRVFAAGGTATTATLLAAIDRVIQLRKNYDSGLGGVKIDVCNINLGRSNRAPGRSPLDTAIDRLTAAGIVGVISAGDAGPSSLTIASPGSSRSAVTVGGIDKAVNTRILIDLLVGAGVGGQFRPRPETQTWVFSSRGPNADGRIDPDVVANALGDFSQGYCPDQSQSADACSGSISIASGTSFSAPIVAGIAAVLRQAVPNASAIQIRNAIIASGNPALIGDGSVEIDRGSGVPDALAAYNLLKSGAVSDRLPTVNSGNPQVPVNVEQNTDLVVTSGAVTRQVRNLRPGQRDDILFNVPQDTASVVVRVQDIRSSVAASNQNQIFGDGLVVDVHSAKTSAVAGGDYLANALPRALPKHEDVELQFTNLDSGPVRVTIAGDAVNAGNVSADVTVYSTPAALSKPTSQGAIHDKQQIVIPVQIPNGTHEAVFTLSWKNDWSHYPTTDLDFTLFPPGCTSSACSILTGATLASPERASLANPAAGVWMVLLDGFDIPEKSDTYDFRVLLDGQAVK